MKWERFNDAMIDDRLNPLAVKQLGTGKKWKGYKELRANITILELTLTVILIQEICVAFHSTIFKIKIINHLSLLNKKKGVFNP